MTDIFNPFPYFPEAGTGGSIYVGAANQDARTNPITVYRDAALTLPWAQPIRTVNGYPAYQGAQAGIYTSATTFSMTVLNNLGAVVKNTLLTSGFVQSSEFALIAGDPNIIRLSGLLGGETLADETSGLASAMALMNSTETPLLIDRNINVSGFTTVNGYCVVVCAPDCWINFTGGSAGFRAINTYTTLGNWTAAPTLAQWPATTGSYNTALTVDSATYAGLSTGDHVYLSDSVNNTFVYTTTNYTNLAEIAMVVAKSGGNTIYLDRVLAEQDRYSSSGTVTKINDNPCRLDLNVSGERTVVREIIRIEGYVRPQVNAVINGNSSRGVMLVGCMGAQVKAFVDNLRDDEPTAFGYGVCAAAATTDSEIWINAKRVRHAYSDIIIGTPDGLSQPVIFRGGVVRRLTVSGIGISCTAATWDTHPFSDSVRFVDIAAYGTHNVVAEQPNGGLNYAMQVRGTNVTIDGFETNLQRGIIYVVDAVRNSVLEVSNFRHNNTLLGTVTTANSLLSFGGFSLTGSGTHKVNIRDSFLQNLSYNGANWNFVSLYNSEVNMATSTSGWPGNAGGNTGCVTEYVGCTVREPASMNVGCGLVFDGGRVIKANVNGFILIANGDLDSRNHGIEITGGGLITNSAYVYSTITSGSANFRYANVWVDDARASGTIRPFVYTASGATITVKDLAARASIYATATVDLPSIAAQGTTIFDVTVPGVSTSITWSLSVTPSADIGALAMIPWVQGTNTVRVRVTNPTAAPIDPASVTMTVEAIRAV